jgi:hypothetical protein
LTLEKIAEFYAFQQKYEQAESFALDALVIRARMHVSARAGVF